MDGVEIFSTHVWTIGSGLRFNSDTMLFSWVAFVFVVLMALGARWVVFVQPKTMLAYIIKRYLRLFVDQIAGVYGNAEEGAISFFCTLATFLLVANALVLIPGCEEPTKDLNCAFALSVAVFCFVQHQAMRAHGFRNWFGEYFKTPIQVKGVYDVWSIRTVGGIVLRSVVNVIIGVALLPMELLAKLSGVLSLSFRLFGNILAGSVISMLWLNLRAGSWSWQLFGMVTGLNVGIALFFGLFEAVVQAGVFTMIAMSYLVRAVQREA